MKNASHLQKIILIIGFFLIAISLYCSFLLYTSFSSNLGDKVAWGGMGLGLDSFKNIALLAALALWGLNLFAARVLSIVVGLAYLLLTVLSFSAFFGFMSTVQHKLETEAMLASNHYRSLQAAVSNAERAVNELSIHADPQAVREAETKLQAMAGELAQVQQGMARWAQPDCTPKRNARGQPYTTRAIEWCGKLQAIEARAAPWQDIIDGHARYKAALAHQERALAQLAAVDSGDAAVGDSHLHPMFVDLGKLLAQAPDEMKVAFMFISSAAAEILGTLSILIAGFLGRKRSFTLDEIEHMSLQLREQQQRLHASLSFFDGPAMLPAGGMPPQRPQPVAAQQRNSEPQEPLIVTPQSKPRAQPETTLPPRDTVRLPHGQEEPQQDSAKPPPDIAEAVLRSRCAPEVSALQARFQLSAAEAREQLERLYAQGLLLRQGGRYYLNLSARYQVRGEDGRYGGIAYTRPDERLQQVYFPQPSAALPVRLRTGDLQPVRWGLRSQERSSGNMPRGGWARVEAVHGGKWDPFAPRPVIIPANGYMQQDGKGQAYWFELAEGLALQGLLAKSSEQEQRLYVVTVDSPPQHMPQGFNTTRGQRWPRVIDLEEHKPLH